MQQIDQARPESGIGDNIKVRVDPAQSQLSEWQAVQRMEKHAVDEIKIESGCIAGVGGDGERDI